MYKEPQIGNLYYVAKYLTLDWLFRCVGVDDFDLKVCTSETTGNKLLMVQRSLMLTKERKVVCEDGDEQVEWEILTGDKICKTAPRRRSTFLEMFLRTTVANDKYTPEW